MPLGVTDIQAITGGVVLLFAAMAAIAVLRLIVRREDRWSRVRFGIFIERDNDPGPKSPS